MHDEIKFGTLFPSRINPNVEIGRKIDISKLIDNGLVTDTRNINRYLGWRLADLAGRFFPEAELPELLIAIEQMTMFFFLDDIFDGEAGTDPCMVNSVCRELAELVQVIDGDTAMQPNFPITQGWYDNWRKMRQGMSIDWRIRASINLQQYFISHVTEAITRKCNKSLTLNDSLQVRRLSSGVQPTIDGIERFYNFELPPTIHQTSSMINARSVTVDVVLMMNEICSFDKDVINNEGNNMINILCRQDDLTIEKARSKLCKIVSDLMGEFLYHTKEIEQACDILNFSENEKNNVQRFIRGCRGIMRGNFEWSLITDRYGSAGLQQVRENPCMDDLLSRVERKGGAT